MQALDLEAFLLDKIPLSKLMQIRLGLVNLSQAVVEAPLSINKNHMGTAFGGSLHTVCVLACYAWLYNALYLGGFNVRLLLKSSEMKYLKPITEDLCATCFAPEQSEFKAFCATLALKKTAQIDLRSSISTREKVFGCELTGRFVARII